MSWFIFFFKLLFLVTLVAGDKARFLPTGSLLCKLLRLFFCLSGNSIYILVFTVSAKWSSVFSLITLLFKAFLLFASWSWMGLCLVLRWETMLFGEVAKRLHEREWIDEGGI